MPSVLGTDRRQTDALNDRASVAGYAEDEEDEGGGRLTAPRKVIKPGKKG